jgi:hypothetical protein
MSVNSIIYPNGGHIILNSKGIHIGNLDIVDDLESPTTVTTSTLAGMRTLLVDNSSMVTATSAKKNDLVIGKYPVIVGMSEISNSINLSETGHELMNTASNTIIRPFNDGTATFNIEDSTGSASIFSVDTSTPAVNVGDVKIALTGAHSSITDFDLMNLNGTSGNIQFQINNLNSDLISLAKQLRQEINALKK